VAKVQRGIGAKAGIHLALRRPGSARAI